MKSLHTTVRFAAALLLAALLGSSALHAANGNGNVPPNISVLVSASSVPLNGSITVKVSLTDPVSGAGIGNISINMVQLKSTSGGTDYPLSNGSDALMTNANGVIEQTYTLGVAGCYKVWVKTNASGNWSAVDGLSGEFCVIAPTPPPTGPVANTPPSIVADDVTVAAGDNCSVSLADLAFSITVSDHEDPVSALTVTYKYNGGALPTSFGKGDYTIVATVTDTGGLSASDSFVLSVKDLTPPTVACAPTTNPSNKNVPTAGTTAGKSGQNPDGFYQLLGLDNCDGTTVKLYVTDSVSLTTFGPFSNGTKIKLVQAPGVTPNVKTMNGYYQIQLKGDGLLSGVDSSNNQSEPCDCLVVAPLPK